MSGPGRISPREGATVVKRKRAMDHRDFSELGKGKTGIPAPERSPRLLGCAPSKSSAFGLSGSGNRSHWAPCAGGLPVAGLDH